MASTTEKKEENKDGEKEDQPMKAVDDEPKELTKAQETMIDNEVTRKMRKERVLDGGIKLVREKVPFIW